MSKVALNRWQLEKNNQTLTILGFSLMLLCITLSITLMTSIKVKGIYHSEEILEDFVSRVSKKAFSFDTESFSGQLEQIHKYLDESVRVSLSDSYTENMDIMEENKIKQEFEIKGISIEEGSKPFLVKVEGERITSSYANPQKQSVMKVDYLFEIMSLKPTKKNPYGLKVVQIHEYPKDEVKKL